MQLSALSTEYVKVPVTAVVNGAVIDPTGDTVQMAFVSPGAIPASGDWKAGSWETYSGVRFARCLVGPSGVLTLTAGLIYDCWLKVADNPETVTRRVGQVTTY